MLVKNTSPHKEKSSCRRNVERTGETNPPGPEDTCVVLHGANICSSRIDRECRFYRSRVDVFRAWTISRVVFAPGLCDVQTQNERVLEKRGDLQRREDDATFCVHLFPSKLTRAIFFHPHSNRSREYFANLAVRWCQKTKPWRGSSLETWLNLQLFAISKRRARTKRILYRRCTERCTTLSLLRFTAKSWECDPERREESENRLAEHRENKRSKSLLHPCRDCCCSILKDFTTTRHDWWYDRTSLFCNV